VALPAFILVPMLAAIREPRRKMTSCVSVETTNIAAPYSGVLAFIKRRRKVVAAHLIGFSFLSIVDYAFLSWMPTYYFRVRGVDIDTMGINFGVAYIVFGVSGIFLGAKFSEMLHSRGYQDAIFRLSALSALLLLPVVWLFILLPGNWSYIAMAIYIFLYSLPWGIAAAAIQLFTPNEFRAQLSALYLLAISITGLTIGPTSVALLTDHFFHDEQQVGLSIAIVCTVCLVGALAALLYGLKDYREAVLDQERLELGSI